MPAERTVLVTGCSSGIGLGLARTFRARGWDVVAGLRDPGRAPELAGARAVALDLGDEAQIAAAARGIEKLDCLVNNAGYGLTGPFSTYTAPQMRRQLQVNVVGPALLTQTLLPVLERARGRIINVSSLAGEVGMPLNSMYCATKHAIEGWSESLRYELASAGVQVALVEPGGFRTRFAANMVWGDGVPAPGSKEAAQLAGYKAMQARRLASPGRDPAKVVAAIVQLAEMERMPLRTRVGADAHFASGIKRWLPGSTAAAIMGAVFRRMMSGGRS